MLIILSYFRLNKGSGQAETQREQPIPDPWQTDGDEIISARQHVSMYVCDCAAQYSYLFPLSIGSKAFSTHKSLFHWSICNKESPYEPVIAINIQSAECRWKNNWSHGTWPWSAPVLKGKHLKDFILTLTLTHIWVRYRWYSRRKGERQTQRCILSGTWGMTDNTSVENDSHSLQNNRNPGES